MRWKALAEGFAQMTKERILGGEGFVATLTDACLALGEALVAVSAAAATAATGLCIAGHCWMKMTKFRGLVACRRTADGLSAVVLSVCLPPDRHHRFHFISYFESSAHLTSDIKEQ